jgi:hypothetical protein
MSKSIAPRCDARCDAWREKCPPHASQNLKRSLQPTETEGLAAPIIMHTGNANFRLPTPAAGPFLSDLDLYDLGALDENSFPPRLPPWALAHCHRCTASANPVIFWSADGATRARGK